MDEAPNTDEAFDGFIERSWALLETPGKWAPLFRRINGVGVIDLVDNLSHPDLPAHRGIILLILRLVVKDRGSEVHFEPRRSTIADDRSGPDLALTYLVDGVLYDLVPPPSGLWPMMVGEFEAIAGLDSVRHRLAYRLHWLASKLDGQPRPHREGRFLVHAGDETLEVELVAAPSDLGERIHLILPAASASLSDRVLEAQRQLFKSTEAEGPVAPLESHPTGGAESSVSDRAGRKPRAGRTPAVPGKAIPARDAGGALASGWIAEQWGAEGAVGTDRIGADERDRATVGPPLVGARVDGPLRQSPAPLAGPLAE